jgi:hypothetical protein
VTALEELQNGIKVTNSLFGLPALTNVRKFFRISFLNQKPTRSRKNILGQRKT